MKFIILLLPCFFQLLAGNALAQNHYIQQTRAAKPDAQTIEKIRQQLQDYQPVKPKQITRLLPFHHREKNLADSKQAFCLLCHLDPPHQKSARKRSFLNQHSRFIACETCHLKDPPQGSFDYRWLAYQSPDAGMWIAADLSVHHQAEAQKNTSIPRPGAKIAPALDGQRAIVFKDERFAQNVDAAWQQATLDEKTRIKLVLHDPLSDEGKSCQSCHQSEKNMLDFKRLGISNDRQRVISENMIAHFFKRYARENERLKMNELLN